MLSMALLSKQDCKVTMLLFRSGRPLSFGIGLPQDEVWRGLHAARGPAMAGA